MKRPETAVSLRILASPGSLKRSEALLQKSAKCRDQGNLIPEVAGKAKKIKGDKLPKSHWFIDKVSG